MQQDFLSPASPLFVAGGPAMVPNLQRALKAARSANASIIHATRRHRATGIDVDQSRRTLFAEVGGFLVAGTPGAEELPQLAPASGDFTIVKTRWSAFFATDLDALLRRLGTHKLILTGVQTPNCIRATANDALSLDYATTVLSDATASQTQWHLRGRSLHSPARERRLLSHGCSWESARQSGSIYGCRAGARARQGRSRRMPTIGS